MTLVLGIIYVSPIFLYDLLQILPDMIRRSAKLFHNVQTATPTYMDLEAFQKAAYVDKVKALSSLTHELRWVKSPAEINLMKESASIACQVLQSLHWS